MRTHKKKIWISLTIFLIVLASCKKENIDSNSFYFTFYIGSKKYIVDTATVNIYTYNNSSSSFEILGHQQSYLYSLNDFGLNPFDTSIIGTYLTTMGPEPKKVLTGGGFLSNDYNDKNEGTFPVHYDGRYSFTISEKTASYISGTFGGTLKDFTSQKEVIITNGRFKLPY